VLTTIVQPDGTWTVTPTQETLDDDPVEILAFPIEVDAVLQHLHRDMRDDWFEDVLQHRDLFSNKNALREVLHELLLNGN
ncbi:hypothetical protein, partial [Burkholderia sp. SIMBA_052]|uniref:hypothetical protein n=1 Tax=Burkholderia sp. SIMBA_052 TaxID=3085793 RepID=UPI00397E089F